LTPAFEAPPVEPAPDPAPPDEAPLDGDPPLHDERTNTAASDNAPSLTVRPMTASLASTQTTRKAPGGFSAVNDGRTPAV
jgi:hypothetical protein